MVDDHDDVLELLRTTGAIREFLPDPVPDEVVYRILATARFAPNGGNRQAWRVVLVKDPEIRVGLRDAYLPGWHEYLAIRAEGLTPFAPVTDRDAEAKARARAADRGVGRHAEPPDFAERFDQAPVLLVVLADLRYLAATDRDLDRYTLVGGASIYPFVWSMLLAAHAEGLGGVITTMAVPREAEVKQLLDVPDHLCLAAVVALGHPVRRPTRLTRKPVESFATIDRFDGPPLTIS
ncbi:MAG: nitroreductase family protein [Acidimicrobiia bacterium]